MGRVYISSVLFVTCAHFIMEQIPIKDPGKSPQSSQPQHDCHADYGMPDAAIQKASFGMS